MQDHPEVQAFLAEADNIDQQIRNLIVRLVAVREQADEPEVVVDSFEVHDMLEGRLNILRMNRLIMPEAASNVDMEPFRQRVAKWRPKFQQFLQEYGGKIQQFEEKIAHLLKEILPAVITQQQVDDDSKKTCSVCLEDFNLEESVKKCSGCQNFFHNNCLQGWLEADNQTCPLCRSVFRI